MGPPGGVFSVGVVMFAAGRLGVKAVAAGDGRFLALAVGLAVEDEFVSGGLEPVDGGLGEERVGHDPEPLDRFSV
jgi:hypothetical protein